MHIAACEERFPYAFWSSIGPEPCVALVNEPVDEPLPESVTTSRASRKRVLSTVVQLATAAVAVAILCLVANDIGTSWGNQLATVGPFDLLHVIAGR